MVLEIEQKALITKEEHDRLVQEHQVIKTIEQSNIYFDTDEDYFKTLSSALRVRKIEDKYELTLKIKAAQNGGHTEHNFEIDRETLDYMIHEQRVPHQLYNIVDKHLILTKHAIIVTERKLINFDNHIVELDLTDFGNKIDYEIEIESEDLNTATSTMDKFLKENNIEFRKSSSKIKRYFDYLQEQK